MPTLPSLTNLWAVNALIRSHNHVYQVAYDAKWTDLNGVIATRYRKKVPGVSYQLDFMVTEQDPVVVGARLNSFHKKPSETFVLNVFHNGPAPSGLKAQYQTLGFEFAETALILGLSLPVKTPRGWTHVHKISTPEEIEFANQGLALGHEHIPLEVHGDAHIINFYAQLEHRAVGWTQLVTVSKGIGYLNQLFTLPVYRRRGIGTRLMRRAHQEANHLGLGHMILLASEMGMSLYRRAGYKPLAYLSVFRPVE